jgi:MoxR-like ATPase
VTPLFDERTTPRPRDVRPYLLDSATRRAVNVALATKRPLLLRGDPGSGKSTLARFVADYLVWDYDDEVITSRTQAQDLLYRFDVVRRLADYNLLKPGDPRPSDTRYVEPGILWRAFDPASAGRHGNASGKVELKRGAVVLLDEIDKADPDVPNDLLVVIESQWFKIPELLAKIEAPTPRRPMLVMITTNGERELPRAFLRRCIACDLPPSDPDLMVKIAKLHFPNASDAVLGEVYKVVVAIHAEVKLREQRPSTAEFLDAVRALSELDAMDPSKTIGTPEQIIHAALWKLAAPETKTTKHA